MPKYTVHCKGVCGRRQDVHLTFKQFAEGGTTELSCTTCGGTVAVAAADSAFVVTLIDGESGSWPVA